MFIYSIYRLLTYSFSYFFLFVSRFVCLMTKSKEPIIKLYGKNV